MALILRNGGSQSPDRWLKEPRNNQFLSFSLYLLCMRVPETTWKVYAHLYPGKDRKLADALNEVRATNDNAEDKNK